MEGGGGGEDQGPWNTTLFPDVEQLELLLEGDWCDRPASTWAIKKSGTLQAKVEAFTREHAHRRPKFVSRDEVPFNRLISFANESFGHDGWSTEVVDIKVLRAQSTGDGDCGRHSLAVETTVRVTLKDGTHHSGTGLGVSENLPQKSMAFSKAKKEAITDGIKNCIRGFGELVLAHEEKLRKGYYTEGGLFD